MSEKVKLLKCNEMITSYFPDNIASGLILGLVVGLGLVTIIVLKCKYVQNVKHSIYHMQD